MKGSSALLTPRFGSQASKVNASRLRSVLTPQVVAACRIPVARGRGGGAKGRGRGLGVARGRLKRRLVERRRLTGAGAEDVMTRHDVFRLPL